MAIFASRGRVLRMGSVLAGGAAVVLLLGAAASAGGAPAGTPVVAGVGATTSGGPWGQAQEVAAALNTGGSAQVNSVSCASAGNCSAGGYYTPRGVQGQAFVVNQVNGVWGKAKVVAAALNTGGLARVFSVSCAAAGNCTAGGWYRESSGDFQAFAITEVNGAWGKAREVAAALNIGGEAAIRSVSCWAPGNCTAGGYYSGSAHYHRTFVVTEVNGAWGTARKVAAALRRAEIVSVSCASAGTCGAGGFYTDSSSKQHAFVINQVNGAWGQAREVAAALNTGGLAQVKSVSCAAAGNCTAGGYFNDINFDSLPQAFAVTEANGAWGQARQVAAALDARDSEIVSVSCAAAGTCSAGGWYVDSSVASQAFVVSKP